MDADRNRLRELLGQVSDGSPVDWDTARRDLPVGEREQADALRDVARIADFSRVLQRSRVAGEDPTLESWGRLILMQRIGSGSAADVYRAWDPELRREVALKLVRTGATGSESVERSPLMSEARAAAAIRHPNVVVVHGIAAYGGRVGMWMELVRGDSLEEIVRRDGPLAPEQVRRLGLEIGSAVQALHAADLMHRDLKPANIVRDENGRWVLTDFGLGTRSIPGESMQSWASGTPMYMAPELWNGIAHSERSEVYALGMVLWFALAGRHPFDVERLDELRAVVAQGPQAALAAHAPRQLVQIVEGAIAPVVVARTPSVDALTRALSGMELHTQLPVRRARRAALVLVPLIAAIAVVALIWPRSPLAPTTGDPASGTTFDIDASLVRHSAGGVQTLIDGDAVQPGDRLSVQLQVSRPVWVYVLNEDERGERYLLFPQPLFDQGNPVPADSLVRLPGAMNGRPSAWTVTSAGEREHFLVVVSPEPVEELEADLARLPAPSADRPVRYAEVGTGSLDRLRGVGGVSPLVSDRRMSEADPLVFDRFRALAGREIGVRGTWVRHIVLENRSR